MPSNVRRFGRYPFGPKRRRAGNLRWTSQQFDGSVVTNTTTIVPIVTPIDYATRFERVEPEGATLMRIRGSFGFRRATDAILRSLYIGIVVADKDVDPSTLQADINQILIDEQWLWHRVWMVNTTALGGGADTSSIEVDVKAKRRLQDATVSLVITNSGPSNATIDIEGVMRALLKMPN